MQKYQRKFTAALLLNVDARIVDLNFHRFIPPEELKQC